MAVQPTYPGVYVQEVPSGVRTIAGVSTSIGLFIGTSTKGPINRPQQVFNYTEFRTKFGDSAAPGQLAQYVKLFFLNGGTNCWVMRIANAPASSSITLRNEANTDNVLRLDAKDAGISGDFIRANVTYRGSQPESTFNIQLFRWEKDSQGNDVKTGQELWTDLSMDPSSPKYAQTYITQNSNFVNAFDVATVAVPSPGFSLSGRPIADAGGANAFRDAWNALLGSLVNTNTFQISVDGRPWVNVNLSAFVVTNVQLDLRNAVANAVTAAYVAAGIPGVAIAVTIVGPANARRLRIASTVNGNVYIRQGIPIAGQIDLAARLMLGTAQGGLEVSSHADLRPAPNGTTYRASVQGNILPFDILTQANFTQVTLESLLPNNTLAGQPINTLPFVQTTAAADFFTRDASGSPVNGNSDGIREKLNIIAGLINNFVPPPTHTWPWRAEVWGYRIAILPKESASDNLLSGAAAFTTAPALPAGSLINNTHYYSLGTSGLGTFQNLGAAGSDGGVPLAVDYDNAYPIIDRDVDLFNLMVLPPVEGAAVPVSQLYGNASVFCQQRRAFLIMDPPPVWNSATTASTGVNGIRIGLVKDYSAVFFPEITVDSNGLSRNIGPAGAMAGLFARTDATRGVWKAPAGIDADLRGIRGLRQNFSDSENGILNPRAINTVRVFPSGIVSWGSRTNFGDDDTPHDYKYIPVRRTALYIEESLYRGLKWVVFEPNDERLWAQIRLSAGGFMNNLFRQGAFQGEKKTEAYFVKCDSETTTQNDINLGIVNVWVGFAPLKPAEFVILYLQQMAGNIQV
jgi:uncharacterized protein